MKPYLAKIGCDTLGPRNDVAPLFADREAFAQLADDLAAPFVGRGSMLSPQSTPWASSSAQLLQPELRA